MEQSNESKVESTEPVIEPTVKPEPKPEPEPPKPTIESVSEGKIKKKRKKARSSPYNVFKKRMMNSEEIKGIPSKKRFAWVAQQWKKEKEKS